MAKSEGNFLTLAELESKGYSPLIFRYLTLGAHYRTPLNFTWESLDAARTGIENLYRAVNDYYRQTQFKNYDENKLTSASKKSLNEYEILFDEAINDDLNTSQALGIFNEILNDGGSPTEKLELVKKFDQVFGLGLAGLPMEYSPENDEEIGGKVAEYNELRSNKQFIQSDALRNEIEALGYTVRDTAEGAYIVKRFFP
jgi:cysteinyl-tRNA synthetase